MKELIDTATGSGINTVVAAMMGRPSWATYALLFIVFVGTIPIQIVFHEAGHVICGWLTGYRLVSIRLGSLVYFKTDAGWRFGRQKIAGTGGQALMQPPDKSPLPYRLYLCGGLLSNGVFTIIGGIALSPWRIMAICWVLASVALILMNGIPAGFNDAQALRIVHREPGNQQLLAIQLTANALLMAGYRYAELPKTLYTPVSTKQRTYFNDFQLFLEAAYDQEMGNYAQAAKILQTAFEDDQEMVPIYAAELKQQLLLMLLLSDPQNSLIPELWADVSQQAGAHQRQRLIIQAVYAWYINHDGDQAKEALAKAQKLPAEPIRADQEIFTRFNEQLTADINKETTA